jgi:hypothetical protein
VQLSEVTVKVILFGFDILYLNGEVPKRISELTFSLYYKSLFKRDGNYFKKTLLRLKENSDLQKIWIQVALKRSKPSSKKASRIHVKD